MINLRGKPCDLPAGRPAGLSLRSVYRIETDDRKSPSRPLELLHAGTVLVEYLLCFHKRRASEHLITGSAKQGSNFGHNRVAADMKEMEDLVIYEDFGDILEFFEKLVH